MVSNSAKTKKRTPSPINEEISRCFISSYSSEPAAALSVGRDGLVETRRGKSGHRTSINTNSEYAHCQRRKFGKALLAAGAD
jgi:hypothetical protein